MTAPPRVSVTSSFCQDLPKIELHAHLSGSVTVECLQSIWDHWKAKEPQWAPDLVAPSVWFNESGRGQNIREFFAHFNTYIYRLINDLDALSLATRGVLQDFEDDGVVYLELRTTPRKLSDATAAEAIRAILADMVSWNDRRQSRMQARLILSIDRSKHSPIEARNLVELALRLREEGLPLVGMDLSGDPHGPLPDYSFAFDLAAARSLPTSLHFAEIASPRLDEEMAQLLSYRPRRLGHVIHVTPAFRNEIISRGIPVELLLTCNILAGMLPGEEADVGKHHFAWWWAQEEAGLSIGTDDVGVFGSSLSEEYRLVSEHFGLGERELVHLVRRGVGGIFDFAQKQRVLDLVSDFETQHF